MQEPTDRNCLERALVDRVIDGVERRHEVVIEWATSELGIERGAAEKIYALAEEERLEPIYAFELVRCGVGVRELEDVSEPTAAVAVQQEPPGWVVPEGIQLSEVDKERSLRQSFRRFRGLLETSADPVAAARAYVAEPDVGRIDTRLPGS